MCSAVAIGAVAGVVAAAGTAAQGIDQHQTQKRARKHQENQARERRRLAQEQEILQRQELALRHRQNVQAAAAELETTRRQASSAIATATVIAGEQGALGGNLDALIGEFSLQRAEQEALINANVEASRNNFELGVSGVELGSRASRISNRLPRKRSDTLKFIGIGLGTVGSGVSSGTSAYNAARPQ